jgi:hypothetical protein
VVAEVVSSVMGNRSGRRLPNLPNALALEAVLRIRRKRADLHHGPEDQTKHLTEAEYTSATGFPLKPSSDFTLGAGSI